MRALRTLLFVLLVPFLLVACGDDDETSTAPTSSEAPATDEAEDATTTSTTTSAAPATGDDSAEEEAEPVAEDEDVADASPVSVVDATGTTLELPAAAERIACLTEPCVDALVELGLTPVAASPTGVAGLDEFYGASAADIPTIGGSFFEPAVEDVIAAEPDIVIGLEGVHEPVRDALGDLPLYIVRINTTDEALSFLADVGTITGRTEAAETAAAEFTAALDDAIATIDSDLSVAVVYSGAYGFNINTTDNAVTAQMIGQIVDYPFTDDDAESSEFGAAVFSVEQLLAADPDYVFVNTIGDDGGQGDDSSVVMAEDAVWGRLTAVAEGRVVDTRTPLWQYGRGTHSLGIILEEFRDAIE